ncbi:MAG: RNA polymerase sigma factor [Anaerolineae bacterium]
MVDDIAERTTRETGLLMRARQGDFEAYEALQQALEPAVRRFVRRLIGTSDLEDDLVQVVFIAFYQHMGRIDPPEHLRPYVYRMARNRCYDELRRQGRFRNVSLDEDAVEIHVSFVGAGETPSQEDAVFWLLLQLEVREAMESLPELQRQALILYAEEGLSYAEIATVMDASIGTIKSRIHHAKKTLRRLLRPETLQALDEAFRDESGASEGEI